MATSTTFDRINLMTGAYLYTQFEIVRNRAGFHS